jgi:hypothetical protein
VIPIDHAACSLSGEAPIFGCTLLDRCIGWGRAREESRTMAGTKPDERETPLAEADSAGLRSSAAMRKAVPPPLPPSGARSNRAVRAATPLETESSSRVAEAPTLYSQVGRRSSPGMPAVSITVDNVAAASPASASAPSSTRGGPPPIPPTPEVPVPVLVPSPSSATSASANAGATGGTSAAAPRPVERARSRFAARPLIDSKPEGAPVEKVARPPLSVRPPAPELFAAEQAESQSIAQTFDRLLGSEVDSRFGELKQGSERPPAAGSLDEAPATLAEVRDLFEQLAANHVRPVREFVIDLRWGEASREWIALCSSAVASLQRAAQKLGLADLEAALEEFARTLQAPAQPGESADILEGDARDRILVAYDKLTLVLPKAFALDMDRAQRESLIVQSLLLQIAEVHRVTIERLHAAGLNGIAMLADARPHEVADAAGISAKLAERIVEAFRAYREDRHAHLPDAMHARERSRVDALLNELEAHHAAFERAAEGWTKEATAEKARLRRARHKTLMEISVVLARIGEIALLRTLEKVPFDRKLDGLRAYLKEAQSSFAHAP